jgi:MFS family permease
MAVQTEESTRAAWRLFALISSATLLTSMNFSLMFVAFGDISDTFDSSGNVVAWALTGFSITSAALLVPAGWMADRFGRERMFISGIAFFALGSLIVATSPWVGVLIVGRVIQAIGLVLETSSALPILLDAFPAEQRATIVGSLGASGGAAAAMGPVIGGALVDSFGWRVTFGLNVPIGMLLFVAVLRKLPMSAPARSKAPPDLLGVAAMAGGMGSLVLAITSIDDWGAGDARTLGAFAAAVVLLGLVVFRSGRHPDPVLYLPLFADPSYRRGVILNVLIAGTFAGTFFSFIQLLTDGWGMSTFHAGVAVAVIPLFGGPLSFVSGRIADRHGPRVVIVPGAMLIVAAGLIMTFAVSDTKDVWGLWLPVGVLYGVGVGFAHAACHAAALRNVPVARLGIGGAMSRIGMDIGGVITVAVAVALVTSVDDPIAGVRRVTLLVSVVCAIGALLALRLSPVRTVPRLASDGD